MFSLGKKFILKVYSRDIAIEIYKLRSIKEARCKRDEIYEKFKEGCYRDIDMIIITDKNNGSHEMYNLV